MQFESFERLPREKKDRIIAAGIREFSEKPFREASTDSITSACSISKGLLFHYFGTKTDFYLYCLEKAMERLTHDTRKSQSHDFYGILFDYMDRKMAVCLEHPDEMHMVNMASRDVCSQTAAGKAEIFGRYSAHIRQLSSLILKNALDSLGLKAESSVTLEGLQIYITALMNRYLLQYQNRPDDFFADAGAIREEMRHYLDLMLCGIVK